MARTIAEIQQAIIEDVQSNAALAAAATNTSKTALWRLWTRIVATAIWSLEKLFDIHKAEMEARLLALHPHTLAWYVQKAKDFQFGYELPPFEERYNNAGLAEDIVEQSKIVTQAAAVISEKEGRRYLRLKLAKGTGGSLAPLAPAELMSFKSYMRQIQDAGVYVDCTSTRADKVTMEWVVEYNPQLIDSKGNAIAGGLSVRDAIKQFLEHLPFNGLYQKTAHIDYVQKNCPGVRAIFINSMSANYSDNVASKTLLYGHSLIPDSGWMRFDNEDHLQIEFVSTEGNDE